jgi:DNA-directed RNA polymerase subunit K/omega
MEESDDEKNEYEAVDGDQEELMDADADADVNIDDVVIDDEDDEVEDDDEDEIDDDLTSSNLKNISNQSNDDKVVDLELEDNEDELLDDSDIDDNEYFQKFDEELKNNYIEQNHPEEKNLNADEIRGLINITRDVNGNIIDDLHKTLPFLTKYEYTSILGIRAKQINEGSQPFIKLDDKDILDGYLIAQMELKLKKIPFIVKRPLPNGGNEYWKLSDLEILN